MPYAFTVIDERCVIKFLFAREPSYFVRVLLIVLMMLVLLAMQNQTAWLSDIRSKLDVLPSLFYRVANVPQTVSEGLDERLVSRGQLLAENRSCVIVSVFEARLQKMSVLLTENGVFGN